jgi:hypothetical protein
MTAESAYLLAADAVLISHVLFVAFVVLGLVLVFVGKWLSWAWVTNFSFRLVHLAAIAIVVLQAWFGVICPLTAWEMQLRQLGGGATYGGSFIQYWLSAILYYDAPAWIFSVVYSVFGGLVVASWVIVPPKRKK